MWDNATNANSSQIYATLAQRFCIYHHALAVFPMGCGYSDIFSPSISIVKILVCGCQVSVKNHGRKSKTFLLEMGHLHIWNSKGHLSNKGTHFASCMVVELYQYLGLQIKFISMDLLTRLSSLGSKRSSVSQRDYGPNIYMRYYGHATLRFYVLCIKYLLKVLIMTTE